MVDAHVNFKQLVRQFCPPVVLSGLVVLRDRLHTYKRSRLGEQPGNVQDLGVYWDPRMADLLETWGDGTVWNEIQFLMVNCRGKVLDLACGTGKTISLISRFLPIEVYGCDISDFLLCKALARRIPDNRLQVCDATRTGYRSDTFDYAYSIGSLEHFTEEGILQCLSECFRIVRSTSFHMVPVSRSGKDEGWVQDFQPFHNNSFQWWMQKYQSVYPTVQVLNSAWESRQSVGKWFVCIKED